MLYSIKDRDDLEKLNELVSLQNQVKSVRLQDKLSRENFHEDMKKVFEPVTKSLENTSQDIIKNYNGNFYQKQISNRELKQQASRNYEG